MHQCFMSHGDLAMPFPTENLPPPTENLPSPTEIWRRSTGGQSGQETIAVDHVPPTHDSRSTQPASGPVVIA